LEEKPIRGNASSNGDDPLPLGAVILSKKAQNTEKNPQNLADDPDLSTFVVRDGHNDDDELEARLAASRAYRREAARFDEQGETGLSNPWDAAPGREGWIFAFYQTVLRVLFAAPRFFSALEPQARPLRALIFYLLVGVLQVVVERFWGYILLQYVSAGASSHQDPQLTRLLTMLAPQANLAMTVLLRTGLLVLELYFFSALIHLCYRFLQPDKAEFSLVFQVIAYSAAPSLLCVIPLIGSLAGFVWSLSCITVGCRTVIRLTWGQTLTGFAPACLIALLFLLQFLKIAQG
jgi:hypothetical protein